MGHKGPVIRPRCIGPRRAQTQILFYSVVQVSEFLIVIIVVVIFVVDDDDDVFLRPIS